MGFRLVQKSVPFNDLERRNFRVVCVISPKSVALCAYYVNVAELLVLFVVVVVVVVVVIDVTITAICILKAGSSFEVPPF